MNPNFIKEAAELLDGILIGYNPYRQNEYLAHSVAGCWPRLQHVDEDMAGEECVIVPVECLEQLLPFLIEAAGREPQKMVSTMTESEFMAYNFGGDASEHQKEIDADAKERLAERKARIDVIPE